MEITYEEREIWHLNRYYQVWSIGAGPHLTLWYIDDSQRRSDHILPYIEDSHLLDDVGVISDCKIKALQFSNTTGLYLYTLVESLQSISSSTKVKTFLSSGRISQQALVPTTLEEWTSLFIWDWQRFKIHYHVKLNDIISNNLKSSDKWSIIKSGLCSSIYTKSDSPFAWCLTSFNFLHITSVDYDSPSCSFQTKILAEIEWSGDDAGILSVHIVQKSWIGAPTESWITNTKPTIDDECSFIEEYAVYVNYAGKMEIFQITKVFINEFDYEIITRFLRKIQLKVPSISMSISPDYYSIGLIGTNSQVLLLKLNGDFAGTIKHQKLRFLSLVFAKEFVYLGCDWNSILVYNLETLSFRTGMYETPSQLGNIGQDVLVTNLQSDYRSKILLYQLNDGSKGIVEVDLKIVKSKKPAIKKLDESEAIKFMHPLWTNINPDDDIYSLFWTVTPNGLLQKYFKKNGEIVSSPFTLLKDSNFVNSKLKGKYNENKVTATHLSTIPFRDTIHQSLYAGTLNGFLVKFSFDTDSVEYVSLINEGEIKAISTYHSSNMHTVVTFIFVLWSKSSIRNYTPVNEPNNWLKIFKEDPNDLNPVELIYSLDTIDIVNFRIITDVTNNWYALIQGTQNLFYQFNAYAALSSHLKVKQVDMDFNNEGKNLLNVLEVDRSLSSQILEAIQNDKKLYKELVLDFIQLTINEDPYTLRKISCFILI